LEIVNLKVQICGKRRFKNSRFILYLQILYDFMQKYSAPFEKLLIL